MVKLGWKGTEIIQALQTVYKDDAPNKICVYKWIKRFGDGREADEDVEGYGRPTTSKNNEKIDIARNLVKEDGRLTVYQIAETVGISIGSAQSILHDNLCLSKLSARWVPKALRPNQLNLKTELSTAILLKIQADEDRFFDGIITVDETWIYQYDPESKQQSKQWFPRGSSGPIKCKSERSVKKVMATVFWDSEKVVLVDFLEGKKTVRGAYYLEVFEEIESKIS